MATSEDIRNATAARRGISMNALLATALATATLAVTDADAEIIKKEDMMRGIKTTRTECAVTPQTLWLSVDKQDFCIRYYLSNAGGEGTRPVVFLEGDHFGRITSSLQWEAISKDRKGNVILDPENKYRDVDTNDLMKTADAFSKLAKTTAIYLARMGVDGSSGNHLFRKSLLELHLMNAALDALKQSHGFEGFHLAGQSGGSIMVAGLAGIRRDVACAVSGSGRLGKSYNAGSNDVARTWVRPSDFIPSIARNRALRFFMVTDAADQKVPAKEQTPFAENMRRAGRDIPQYFVTATDDDHHGAVRYAELVAAGCVLGKSDADIATAVTTMVKQNAAYNEQRRKEIVLFGKSGIAAGGQARVGGKRV